MSLLERRRKVTAEITVTSGISETGKPNVKSIWSGKVTYCEKQKVTNTPEGPLIQNVSVLLIPGNVTFPQDVKSCDVALEGESTLFKVKAISRPRGYSNKVMYTRLELM